MDRAPRSGRPTPQSAAGTSAPARATGPPAPEPAAGPPDPGARGIAHRELEVVIRRAAELHLAERDADERVPEDEVIRIATELGLAPRHVRQALYELPEDAAGEPGFVDRAFGSDRALVSRAVPGDVERIRARLLEYLTTREYLQLRRRQGHVAWFEPADDAVSNMIRALRRPARRFHLSRARRVGVAVRPIESGTAHIRVEMDLSDRRRGALAGGLLLGGLTGTGVGAGAFVAVGAIGLPMPTPAGLIAGLGVAGASFALGVTGGITAASVRFRRRVAAARIELEGLLDRLERGESLRPPPAPWWRRLQGAVRPPARERG